MKRNDNYDDILSAARSVFSKYGYKKTTLDDIAFQIKKGKSSLYYYFASKDDIFKAVIEYESNIIIIELKENISSIKDPLEQLETFITIRFKLLKKVVVFYDALNNDLITHLDFVRKIREKYDILETEMVKKILQNGIDSGKFHLENVDITSLAILTAIKGIDIPLLTSKEENNIEKKVKEILRVLFYGIVKR